MHERIVVFIAPINNDVWFVAYSVRSQLILVWPAKLVHKLVIAPVVAARRIATIPIVGVAGRSDIDLLGVVYEVVMVKSVVRRVEPR